MVHPSAYRTLSVRDLPFRAWQGKSQARGVDRRRQKTADDSQRNYPGQTTLDTRPNRGLTILSEPHLGRSQTSRPRCGAERMGHPLGEQSRERTVTKSLTQNTVAVRCAMNPGR